MPLPDVLVHKALKAWRFLYKRGFIEGFGHLSVRLPGEDEILLTRHSLGPVATADDLLLMDLQGRKRGGAGDLPGEAPIHLEIFKARPDVASIVHYHGLYSTAFTTSKHALKPIHLMGTLFHDGIPIYPDCRLVTDGERGAALAQALGSRRAVLMHAHGAAVTGASIEEAIAGTFLFEENARRACASATLGEPLWLDPQTAADAGGELIRNRGAFRRVWALVESDDQD